MDRRRSCVLAALLATASAFAPRAAPRCGVAVSESPLDRLGGLLGGKKAAPPPIVEDVAVDDVAPGEMTTAVEGLTPELDGLRKANALFNQGLIGRDEIDEYSRTPERRSAGRSAAAAAAAAEKKRERERREASERVANASLSAASFVAGAAGNAARGQGARWRRRGRDEERGVGGGGRRRRHGQGRRRRRRGPRGGRRQRAEWETQIFNAVKGLAGAVVDAAVVKPAKAVGDKVAYGSARRSAPSTPPPPRPPPASCGGRRRLRRDAAGRDAPAAKAKATVLAASRLAAESGKEEVVEADFAAAASETKGTALAVDEGVRVESEVVLDDGDGVFDPASRTTGAIFSAARARGSRPRPRSRATRPRSWTESVVADTKAAARAAAEEKVAEKQFKAAAEKARADELQRQEYKYETAGGQGRREALRGARPPRPRPRGRRRAADRARRPQARARVGPLFLAAR
ncbi:hypothetical protein SO694_00017157 [Aureococcus anophagefferens]|uniref:Uncharacterized protein n=1 Tax=Aureococcus anophagefferens TaxID=44056 RepID=A0ABR1G1M0_AURAN